MTATAQLVRPCSTDWHDYLELVSHDFFQTAEYHAFSAAVANSEAWLLVYGDAEKFVAWPYLLQPIEGANSVGADLRDVTSVYGYSGPLVHQCQGDDKFLCGAWQAFVDSWRAQSVVSVFTRFHPILGNQEWLQPEWTTPGVLGHTYKGGKTVVINLSKSPEQIWTDYQRKLRQHLRRVEREQDFTIVHDQNWEHLDDFVSMYHETLQRNNATEFYFFSVDYFNSLKQTLGSHGSLFLCMCGDTAAAAFLLIEYNGIVSVHLAASREQFSSLSPNKWLFHEAQILSRARGNRYLHIGGGRGSRDDDPLFRFKAQFSSTYLPFYTGRWILDRPAYEFLAAHREQEAQRSGDKCLVTTFFPIYRAPLVDPRLPEPVASSRSDEKY
jgi:hypothetical protein